VKLKFSNVINSLVCLMVTYFGKYKYSRYFMDLIIKNQLNQKVTIEYGSVKIDFNVPNQLNRFRATSFATKEPETLQWIDSIPYNSILWDIGANVGLYSCYAAKSRNCIVYAFEPSIFNIEILARNIFINNLEGSITIVPIPLSDKTAENSLNMTCTDWGGALSTFGETYGQNGTTLIKLFTFKTIGITMQDVVNFLHIPQPDYIKIDVDGIEHLILKGGLSIIKNVKGLIIEIDENFEKQFQDSTKYLTEAGFIMKYKHNADKSGDPNFSNCYNQVWVNQTQEL
jgi:FkbM family methyltransferase